VTFYLINIYSYCDDSIDNQNIEASVFKNSKNSNIITVPKISSVSGIVIDRLTGRVLYEKRAYTERPMASTTKIMTAILALERGKLKDTVTVTQRAARVTGSNIHLKENERISLNDLLYGLMLSSGNDAAIAIAEHIGGTVENFALMMTKKANEIGAKNTAFQTPHGLDKDGHYSTPYDLAIMARYALKNKKFAEIVSTRETIISGGRKLTNTNEMLTGFPGADGVKTGYTGKAGRCLVSSATRKGWQIISVVLGSASRQIRASDSAKILSYAFNSYELVNLDNLINTEYKIKIDKGKVDYLVFKGMGEELYPLRKDEVSTLKVNYNFPKKIEAPCKKGAVIGHITYSSGGKNIKSFNISLTQNIEKKSLKNFYDEIVSYWLTKTQQVFIDSVLKL